MVSTVCLGVIHKVPARGMSAVGDTVSDDFFYDNGIISDANLEVVNSSQ